MSIKIQCPFCHKEIEGGDTFCRYCGQHIPKAVDNRQAVVNRTADFSNLEDAINAIVEYFDHWPDGPEARDISFTRNCVRFLNNIINLSQGKFNGEYENISRLADDASKGLPLHLANGMITSAQVHTELKKDMVITWMKNICNGCANILQQLYDNARKEQDSLLVDGKTRSIIKKMTKEDIYRDAEVHYASYEKGDLDAALKGFTYLKELNPFDAYFRNVLGLILLQQEKPLPALQEFLFGLSMDPGEVKLTANTLRCLCGLALFPAAVEVARHYESIGGYPAEPLIQPWASLARASSAAVALKMLQCTLEDVSPSAADLIDEFEILDRAWLVKPKSSAAPENLLYNTRIFISYRHSGGLDYAEHLEQALKGAYPSMHVFRDQSFLVPGQDFVDQLREEIDKTDVFLALIDKNWIGGKGKMSRLHNRKDILRREVARAFNKDVIVIPVLLDGSRMPNRSDLPDELNTFSQLHAQNLSESGFDNDFGLLQSAMIRLLTTKKLEEQAIDQKLQELEKTMEEDPEAAEDILKSGIEQLEKYMPGKSVHGEGVPLSSVEFEGLWQCTIMGPGGEMTIQFTTEGTKGRPFQGELQYKERNLLGVHNMDREEIKGAWMPVIDTDKEDLLLGIFLDGLKSGEIFKLNIPFHRRLGKDLVGTDSDGMTYSSRNVEPRIKGF